MSNQERKQFDEWRERFINETGFPPNEADAWQARAALAQQAEPKRSDLLQKAGERVAAMSDGDFSAAMDRCADHPLAAAPAEPQAERQDERDLAINAETCAVCGEGKALLVRSCSCCGSLYAGSAEMRENQKQAGQAPAVQAGKERAE